jgi:hypothetical protein
VSNKPPKLQLKPSQQATAVDADKLPLMEEAPIVTVEGWRQRPYKEVRADGTVIIHR